MRSSTPYLAVTFLEVKLIVLSRYRQQHAPTLFLGAFLAPSSSHSAKPVLLGFICSTLTSSPLVTHASMSAHDPHGTTIAIHSLCVSPTHRRMGVGYALLQEYAKRAHAGAMGPVERVALMSRAGLTGLYEQAGFREVGESAVQHGKEKWVDMVLDIKPASEEQLATSVPSAGELASAPLEDGAPPADGPTQAQVIAALLAQRSAPPAPDSATYASLTAAGGEGAVVDEKGRNRLRLRCLRKGCGSLILLEGKGELREGGEENACDVGALSLCGLSLEDADCRALHCLALGTARRRPL
jgi:ribosomal protein S18 acetylase RimI-like enzyme